MPIKVIDIRELSPEGPSVPGKLLARCPVVGIVTDYAHPAVDIQLPDGFNLPEHPIHIHLYADNKYFGHLLLGPDGFAPDPESMYTSSYFKIGLA